MEQRIEAKAGTEGKRAGFFRRFVARMDARLKEKANRKDGSCGCRGGGTDKDDSSCC